MQTLTIPEYHSALKDQGVPDRADFAMICPMCGTVQSARDLIAAGAGIDFEGVEMFLGFSCVGRWNGAGSPRSKPDGKPCDWTLGGLLNLHKLEVIDAEGKKHPRFEVATPAQAQQHARKFAQMIGAA
ncbi:VVA0879 family protein [Paracoccus sp. (in: a-proteobacteria)]|uniref:VVA0879 family protein n=1 Tax=Paracoccus sp. TaxID=267 RepID=UPI0028A6750A|nr:VVA0879 family protein [Paracoccus sp. (in: a-proteobacteria)]